VSRDDPAEVLELLAQDERNPFVRIKLQDAAQAAQHQSAELARLRQESMILRSELRLRRADETLGVREAIQKLARWPDDDVRAAHEHLGSPVRESPGLPDGATAIQRRKLMLEEARELAAALLGDDVAAIAQEAIDLIYIAAGALVECGVDMRPVWELVHAANLRKVGVVGGKWQKPEGWAKPDVAAEVERQRRS
jgi:predicted HAD superfamily Cof-like phosphohydrolase